MSKRCQCVGKKMALLVLRRVSLCIGQNQMCHFVRLAFRVIFLSVKCCSVGRHRVAANGAGICGSAAIYVLEAKINYLRHYANTYVMR